MQNNYMQIFIAMPMLFANCFFNICKWHTRDSIPYLRNYR